MFLQVTDWWLFLSSSFPSFVEWCLFIPCLVVQRESTKDFESPKFKDIQKLIANKLDNSKVKKEAFSEAIFKTALPGAPASSIPRVIDNNAKPPPCPSLPPPPPPPLPSSRPRARGSATPKTPTVIEFYRLLTKPEEKRDESRSKDSNKPAVTSAHSSIVGEIQNRSAHLLAVSFWTILN